MKRDDDRAVEQLRLRLIELYLLKYGLAALTVWAFLYGSAVLALRGAVGMTRESLAWGLASLPLALLPAVLLAWKRMPSPQALRALIDRHSRCGGLLMAGEEQSLAGWESSLPALRLPSIQWRGNKTMALFTGGLAFVALGFLVPQGFANLDGPRLDVDREVEKLTQQIDVLNEEKVLAKERAALLTAKLEQLRRDASGKDPVKTLEALDHVADQASKSAQDAAEAAIRRAEQLARAQTMAEALDKLLGKMEPAKLTEAMNELAALAKKAATEEEMLHRGLDPEIMDALKKGSGLTKEQLKKLTEALKEGKIELSKKVERMVKAKLLDAAELEKCDKAGKCDCEALAAFLKENGATSDLSDAIANSEDADKGGVTRGPGAAKLEFGDETNEDGFTFKEEALPPAALQAIKESEITGLSPSSPNTGKDKRKPGASGALDGAMAGGGSANTQVVLPRHRGAVERYFDRPAKSKK
jgi:phosphate uptake regulator